MSTMNEETTKMGDQLPEKKTALKGYQQKLTTVKARIRYREHTLKGFKQHLKNGTFPPRMKSIKPYPKMETPEAQTIVNAACQQVERIMLDQMIQEQEQKLAQDQDSYQTMRKQREGVRQTSKGKAQPPRKSTMVQLQQELKELQSKYTELCSKLANQE